MIFTSHISSCYTTPTDTDAASDDGEDDDGDDDDDDDDDAVSVTSVCRRCIWCNMED